MQDRTAAVISRIVEKLLPWFRVQWLYTVAGGVVIRITDIECTVRLDTVSGLYKVAVGRTDELQQGNRIEAVLNGGLRDDEGNIYVPATT